MTAYQVQNVSGKWDENIIQCEKVWTVELIFTEHFFCFKLGELRDSISKCYQMRSRFPINLICRYTCMYNYTLRYYSRICLIGRIITSHSLQVVFLLGCIENKTLFVFPGVEQDHYTSVKNNRNITTEWVKQHYVTNQISIF